MINVCFVFVDAVLIQLFVLVVTEGFYDDYSLGAVEVFLSRSFENSASLLV